MKRTHWQQLEDSGAMCGEPNHPQLTLDMSAITCGRCRRLLGIAPYTVPLPAGYRQTKSDKRLDSLISKAFKSTEGELAVALTEAEHALAESLKCKDPGEIIGELSGALRRLVDLLGSTSNN